MAESRVFKLMNGVTLEMLGEAVESFLRDSKGMQTQAGQTTEGYLVQGKQEADGWKRISGTDQAISVQMFKAGDVVNVTTGFGKWSDKIGAGVVGYFVFAPLAITAAIGAFMQKKLPGEIFDYIEKFILSGGTTNATNLTVNTSGNSAAAIRSDRGGGTVVVDKGIYTSNGYNSPAVYSTADITVSNAELTSNNSEALVIEGKNSIKLNNCDVSGNMSST